LVAHRAYAVKGRVKSSDDICDKVLGRRHHEDPQRRKPDYQPNEVTDCSGFRIVKLFNAEVPEALDELLSLLETTLPRGPLNGRLTTVKEIEFHTSRRLDDPLSIYRQVNAVVEKHGFKLKPPISASSYSSVHVLLECEVGEGSKSLTSYSEVQLRSVFEEAWGEISHRLKYAPTKASRASGTVSSSKDDEFWLHLDALKSLTDGCAQYADLINRQIKSLETKRGDREALPLDPAEKSAAQFIHCSPAVREAVEKAYRLRSEAVETKEPDVRAATFRKAADAFEVGIKAFAEPETAEQKRLFDLLREELAFCYVFTRNEELRSRAEKIYRELLITKPNSVSVLLRLGQLQRDAADYVEARKLMEAALTAAEQKPDPDPEIQRQANWVLRRDLAYVYWRLSELEPAGAGATGFIRHAIELSEASLGYVKNDVQQLNTRHNLLYYLADLWARLPIDGREQTVTRGRQLLEEMRPQVRLKEWPVEQLDTVMRAEAAFGDPEIAPRVAKVVAERIASRIAMVRKEQNCSHAVAFDLLSRDERDMYLQAQDILVSSDR
jgi:ppGpp synthetase/RelA/SpoT-type nucleotidyltranferase